MSEQELEYSALYGTKPAEWLSRWDNGQVVWSVEMGGLGPGYEQCIQIMAAEMLRHFLTMGYDASLWEDPDVWKKVYEETDKAVESVVQKLYPSGAQFDAALNLANNLYRRGPYACFTDPRVKDRLIQVSKNFPDLGIGAENG